MEKNPRKQYRVVVTYNGVKHGMDYSDDLVTATEKLEEHKRRFESNGYECTFEIQVREVTDWEQIC